MVIPHEALLARLRELETYRAAAAMLGERPTLGHDVFASPPKVSKIDPALIPLADHPSELLTTAFQEVLKKLKERGATYTLTLDTVSIVDRMRSVVDTLRNNGGTTTFQRILENVTDRISAVGTFVAILELCRRRVLGVVQESPRGEIQIKLMQEQELPTTLSQQEIAEAEGVVEVAA
jgi:segregation and condensation protein A